MQIGSVYIDTNAAEAFVNTNSTSTLVIMFLAYFGWIIIVCLLLFMGLYLLKLYKQKKYMENWSWVLLAIDVPPLNVQTPKAVEQMFAHLMGAWTSSNITSTYRKGFKQRWFSFEIVSIEGYIQFLIRTEKTFRDLVEAAVYAQYPEAEITEVEDYTKEFSSKFPNDEYDMWGANIALAENDAYPIRTYVDFEHTVAESNVMKDPMGTFLESFSRIGSGEQLWFQILVEPTSNDWKESVIEKIKDIVGDVVSFSPSKKSWNIGKMFGTEPGKALSEINSQIFGPGPESSDSSPSEKKNENVLLRLTPGQKKILEAMEDKITKVGFKTKIRTIYLARKEVYRPERSINILFGAINQFNIPSANSLLPVSTVKTDYFLKKARGDYRKRMLMSAYKKREMIIGPDPFMFNIEELATIWHFPLSHVKTPLLQKTQGKRVEPPSGLPIEGVAGVKYMPVGDEEVEYSKEDKKIVTDAGDVAYFSSDEEYG